MRLQPKEPNLISQFIKVVSERAEKIRAEEPYRMAQKQAEIKEMEHQQFLNSARIVGFDEKQAEFMWTYIRAKMY